jgi:ABC-type multidrug transport system fused ATPase/permease subunit
LAEHDSRRGRIHVLERGGLVGHGTHDELMERHGLYLSVYLASRPLDLVL